MSLLFVSFTLFFVGTAMAADHVDNSTATATPTVMPSATAAPGAGASPTPVPTPAPRQVFSSPAWATDHETIGVVNNGAAITVTAWIDKPSKSATTSVGAGESMTISTPSMQVQNGQIVSFGFEAYENNTLVDSYNNTIAAISGPTPTTLPPESVTISSIVTDANTGSPIANATVTFQPMSYEKAYPAVSTDSDGAFTSPKMFPDVYKITVTAKGYQRASLTTDGKITGDAMVETIVLNKLSGPGASTPTPTPVPPTPTPQSLVDSWSSLLYNPALCLGSLSALIAVVAGSIGIYEWLERKRKERVGKEKEDLAKGGNKLSEPPATGEKKP